MKQLNYLLGLLLCLGLLAPTTGLASDHSMGIGAYYQKTLGDIKDSEDFDEDAISWLVSYQYALSELFKLEADLEFTPDYGGSDEVFYLPQAYVLFGTWIYAGAGIGMGYINSEWSSDPMYAFRGGLDLPMGDRFSVDINANYRFLSSSAFDDIDSEDADSITFGAQLRYNF